MSARNAPPGPEQRPGPLFLANHLALDFINTRPLLRGKLVELLPDFSSLLGWFLAAQLLTFREAVTLRQKWGVSARARRATEAMRAWREKMREQVLAWERGEGVQPSILRELNALMAAHPMRTRLKPAEKKAYSTELWLQPRVPEDLFAPLAHSAAILFADLERRRVRKCPTCVLHFYDTSKKGTRRWCSMQLCGNRRKVAAYAARRRTLA